MLNSGGFDLWADGYDKSVRLSDEKNEYPFAGYRNVLNGIYRKVLSKPGAAVLDLGFGTGVLTARLYRAGCGITGIDFSEKMMETAAKKMPEASLFRGDFSQDLPDGIREKRYDYIISTYAFHHVSDGKKAELIRMLSTLLRQDGEILIGDISFRERNDLEVCRRESGRSWDGDEIYLVADEMERALGSGYACGYEKISGCSGNFYVRRK